MHFHNATVAQCLVLTDDRIAAERIEGRSCLGWLLREFSRFGVTDFLLLGPAPVPDDLQDTLPHPVRITVIRPPQGTGSAGALRAARDQLQDRFLLSDGGRLFDWNLAVLLADAATDPPTVSGRIVQAADGTDRGIGWFRREVADDLPPNGSLAADVLPALLRQSRLRVTRLDAASPDAASADDASRDRVAFGAGPIRQPATGTAAARGPALHGATDVVTRLRRKALFLDRDGVLNIDHGYVGSRDRFEWVDGAVEAIRYATASGWHVFVVTNQSGVARGLYTEDAVRTLLAWMADEARAAGGTIDDVRFCPFHPEAALDAYRQDHPWRKPLPGMVLDLIEAWELDPQRAVLAGDQETDMRAAAAAGVAGHLFRGGNLHAFLQPILDRCI